jgi:hypothetical protein
MTIVDRPKHVVKGVISETITSCVGLYTCEYNYTCDCSLTQRECTSRMYRLQMKVLETSNSLNRSPVGERGGVRLQKLLSDIWSALKTEQLLLIWAPF